MNISLFSCVPLSRRSTEQVQSTENRNKNSSTLPTQQGTPSHLNPLSSKSRSETSHGEKLNISNDRNKNSAPTRAVPSSFKKATPKIQKTFSQKLTRAKIEINGYKDDILNDISKQYRQIVPNKETRQYKKSEKHKLVKASEKNSKDLENILAKLEKLEQKEIFYEENRANFDEKKIVKFKQEYNKHLKIYNNALLDLNYIKNDKIPPRQRRQDA
jgi:vacuolar-type H+-ATPase subunit H